jgi:hypothetical protein
MTFLTSVFSDATLKGEALTVVVLCWNTMVSCGGWLEETTSCGGWLEETTVLSSFTYFSLEMV